MPKQISAFACVFCGRIYKYALSAMKHQRICFSNPIRKSCKSCRYWSVDHWGCCRMDGDWHAKWWEKRDALSAEQQGKAPVFPVDCGGWALKEDVPAWTPPRVINAFQCEWCGKICKSLRGYGQHEKTCGRNPAVRSCLTCSWKGRPLNGRLVCDHPGEDYLYMSRPRGVG